ncbi:MAG TPA: MoaD/ThiS family protein [Pyrinomonadaceae bacterium]|jgi:molybdopterin converting factor small subunit|nr:MoaD/ThiS family protein [Pyrinomonadaceae bacterium]
MKVIVKFFGATAEVTGERDIEIELRDTSSVEQAVASINGTYPHLEHHKLLFALNQEYCSLDHILSEGDEVAIFTAVSGG